MIAGPVLGVLEDVEEVAFRHASADFLLEFRQPLRLVRRWQLLQMRRPVRIDAQLGVVWKPGIELGGHRRQFVLQRGGEILAAFGDAERGAIGRQPRLALRPRQELGAVVGEVLGADDIEIASLQGIGQMDEDADFERTPIEDDRFRTERLTRKLCQR